MVSRRTVVGSQHDADTAALKIFGQHNLVLVPEAQDSGGVAAVVLCSLQHRRHADASADHYRLLLRLQQRKAVAQRAHHVDEVVLLHLGHHAGSLSAHVKEDADAALFAVNLTDGDRPAQGETRHPDVHKLSRLCPGGDVGAVDGEVAHAARQYPADTIVSL